MDVAALQQLSAEQQSHLRRALLEDNFFVPLERMEVDRATGDMRIRYLRTEVSGAQTGIFLLLFTRMEYWDSLRRVTPAVTRPSLAQLQADLGNAAVVVDLGATRPFTATLAVLTALRTTLLPSGEPLSS